jgi:enoyl-CoA hydratase/carnithine racemase
MDLATIDELHPSWDAERRLLVLTFEHGKANEMGTAQIEALERLCDLVERGEGIMCLCSTSRRTSGSGKPIFIAGANVTERVGWDDGRVLAHVVRQRALLRRVRRLPVFHVVLVSGVALGWGTEYVLTGDYAIATALASFALPETGLGIIPGARGSGELADLVGVPQALRLGCTGEAIGADEARRIGLVQEVVDDVDAGLVRVHALAELLRRRSPAAVAAYKRAVIDARGVPESDRLAIERRAYEQMVEQGEAAIGRANFQAILGGQTPAWGPRRSSSDG